MRIKESMKLETKWVENTKLVSFMFLPSAIQCTGLLKLINWYKLACTWRCLYKNHL